MRIGTNTNQTDYQDSAFVPFGEEYGWTNGGTDDYTGQLAATQLQFYDFPYREYSAIQGRWLSPDPAGLSAANPANPQSWNRYAYALNNPLALVDPTGELSSVIIPYFPSDPLGGGGGGSGSGSGGPCITREISPGAHILNECGQSGGGGGSANNGAANNGPTAPVVLNNPCSVQGRALPPSAYATQGQQANASTVNFVLDIAMGWPRGDYLDPQPLASGDKYQNQAYGNYVFGVYMQAAGFSLSQTLSAADAYAGYSKLLNWNQYSGNQIDPNYSFLPAASVTNITNGYNAQANGSVCHN